jgi:hypothetical protein
MLDLFVHRLKLAGGSHLPPEHPGLDPRTPGTGGFNLLLETRLVVCEAIPLGDQLGIPCAELREPGFHLRELLALRQGGATVDELLDGRVPVLHLEQHLEGRCRFPCRGLPG